MSFRIAAISRSCFDRCSSCPSRRCASDSFGMWLDYIARALETFQQPILAVLQCRRVGNLARRAGERERLAGILGPVLTVLCELFQRLDTEWISRSREVIPNPQGRIVCSQFAFKKSEVPENAEKHIVRNYGFNGAAK